MPPLAVHCPVVRLSAFAEHTPSCRGQPWVLFMHLPQTLGVLCHVPHGLLLHSAALPRHALHRLAYTTSPARCLLAAGCLPVGCVLSC